jgi:hypothetical protein
LRRFIYLPLLAAAGCATAGERQPTMVGSGVPQTNAPNTQDPSALKWIRLYCTPDNESHFEDKTATLDAKNFAPPASPIFIGGGGTASKVVFGGFEQNWGVADIQSGKTHPTPVVQWITVVAGSMEIRTTDGGSRVIRAGDVMHLEDAAPCKGHITQNLAPGATFLQFVQQ